MRYCSVVPKEVTTYYGVNFRSNPIVPVLFIFKIWDENVKLVLLKNQKYFEKDVSGNKLPFLDAISVRFIPDIQSEFMLFLQEKFDFYKFPRCIIQKDELLDSDGTLRSKYFEKINMLKGPYLNSEYIGIFLDSKAAIKSKNIRKALNIGFDRKFDGGILEEQHRVYPAKKGFIPKGLPGTSDEEIKYDPKLAKRLVENYIKETGERPSIKL